MPFSLLLLTLASTGCLVAGLQPVYTEEQLVQDDRVLGHWEAADERISLSVGRGEWKSYRVTYKGPDIGRETAFSAHLTEIGRELFADATPAGALERSELIAPLHAVFRVVVSEEKLSFRSLDYEWFASASRRDALVGLSHAVDTRQHLILTGSPQTTRRWLANHLKDDQIYAAPVEFERR